MAGIRTYERILTIATLVGLLVGGVLYPTVHRLEHAVGHASAHTEADAHDHSDHGNAVEAPQPDFVADSCWICVRSAESHVPLGVAAWADEAPPSTTHLTTVWVASQFLILGGPARAPPSVA